MIRCFLFKKGITLPWATINDITLWFTRVAACQPNFLQSQTKKIILHIIQGDCVLNNAT